MHYLIYISTAINLMDQDELSSILTQSRKNNTAKQITGMLLYSQGTFIQAIEGDKNAIDELYKTLSHDRRHKNLVQLISGDLTNRIFPDWSMGFLALSPEKMAELEGYINPAKQQLFKGKEKHSMITVMKTFADNNNLMYPQ